jgi:hypothetical protein
VLGQRLLLGCPVLKLTSSGERAGWVQKLSQQGLAVQDLEGELALVSLPGSAVEKFYSTVHDDAVAQQITQVIGRRVSLHYEEKVGLPTSCFGDTRHFVTSVTVTPDIPLGPGLTLPNVATPAPPAASAQGTARAARARPGCARRPRRRWPCAARCWWRSAVSQMFFRAPTMILSRRRLISSSVQKNELKSCTHSK